MKTYRLFGCILCLSVGIFLQLGSASAKSKEKYPTGNVNMSPFQAWRSAYECLIYGTNPCQAKNVLTMKGVVYVPAEETKEYCKPGGCGQRIKSVLTCIHQVKRDFWFANKAPVKYLQDAIATGCNSSTVINTTEYPNSGGIKKYQSFSKSLMLGLPTVLFMAIFTM